MNEKDVYKRQVSGLRNSWLMANSKARLASSIWWMSLPMALMVWANCPNSSQ